MGKNTVNRNDGYTVDRLNGEIVVGKRFAKMAGVAGSAEEKLWDELIAKYPNYEIKAREIRKNDNKQTHNGLTIDFMRKCVLEYANDGNNNIVAFDAVVTRFKGHPAYYGKVKAWFLGTYDKYMDSKAYSAFVKQCDADKKANVTEVETETEIETEVEIETEIAA